MTSSTIRSMTGQGQSPLVECEVGSVRVEVRTLNHRNLKVVARLSDSVSPLEPQVERFVRSRLHRGSVQISIRVHSDSRSSAVQIDPVALQSYVDQLQSVEVRSVTSSLQIDLGALLELPGVMAVSTSETVPVENLWTQIEPVLVAAMDDLDSMRHVEGVAMANTLQAECDAIAVKIERCSALAPQAAQHYAARLETKVQKVLSERSIEVQPIDLIREIQIYADRSDVSEEVTRLRSHLDMFVGVINNESDEPVGRKLEFIIQEMSRETNTIGSKAAHSEVSGEVVEIKCGLERMRELIQNLE